MSLLNLKVFLWNSYRTGAPQKIKNPQKIAQKWTFLSLAFYNAPSLHTVDLFFGRNWGGPCAPDKPMFCPNLGNSPTRNRSLPKGPRIGTPPAPYRSLPGPPGPKSPKSLRKSLLGVQKSRARKPWSANRELRGWQKRGCRDRCQQRPEKGA